MYLRGRRSTLCAGVTGRFLDRTGEHRSVNGGGGRGRGGVVARGRDRPQGGRCTRFRCACGGQAIGALNLFHRRPGPLPDDDLALGQALADVATIGIVSERSIRRGDVVAEQLQTALNSRVIIEQAKGVLAQALGLTMDAAFDRLRKHSRNNNLRLSEIARQIVNGELDTATLAQVAPGSAPSRHH